MSRSVQHLRAVTLALAFVGPTAWGEAAIADTCSEMLKYGVRDVQTTNLTESRFNEVRQSVCTSSYDSYSKATSSAQSGGFDVVGYFGISGSNSNAANEYATKWSNFCQADYGKAISDTDLRTYSSTINLGLLQYFDRCVSITAEQFIRYVQPSQDGKTFSIVFNNRRSGVAGFQIDQLTLKDTTTGGTLDPTKDCDLPSTLPYNTHGYNALNIVCSKAADHEVIVNGMTTAGLIEVVRVPAVPTPPPALSDRVTAIAADLKAVTERLNAAGSPALVYSGSRPVESSSDTVSKYVEPFDFSTKVANVNADVETGQAWRFRATKPGLYHVMVQFTRPNDNVANNAYVSCSVKVLRKGHAQAESALSSYAFDTTCNVGSVVQLASDDQLFTRISHASGRTENIGGMFSLVYVGSP
jgi:hypothetical protein